MEKNKKYYHTSFYDWKDQESRLQKSFIETQKFKLVPLFSRCAKDLCDYIEKFAENGQDIPLKE